MIEHGQDKNSPPLNPPSPAPINEGEGKYHDDDGGSSCNSDFTGSIAAASSLSSKSGRNGSLNNNIYHSSGSLLSHPIDFVNSPSRKVEEVDDEKARMIAQLMKNHAGVVSFSLFERSNLVQSIIRLSHHVPGCVISSLLNDIKYSRGGRKETVDRHRRKGNHPKSRRRTSDSCETCDENKVYEGEQFSSAQSKMSSGQCSITQLVGNSRRPPRRKTYDSCETCEENKVYEGDRFSSADSKMSSSQRSIAQLVEKSTLPLPLSRRRQSALLFVDISGFTKLSTMLDVDSFSNCINAYFQKIISQVASYGGDILKFAGDAIFCEWRVSSQESCQTLEQCVLQATSCAIAIVASCSDFNLIGNTKILSKRRSSHLSSVDSSNMEKLDSLTQASTEPTDKTAPQSPLPFVQSKESSEIRGSSETRSTLKRRVSVEAPFKRNPSAESTLNIKCGLGVGPMAGLHVGDNISRREFLILGDPIDQVAAAEAAAKHGEVFASPEVVTLLAKMGTIEGDWESNVNNRRPTRLAVRLQRYFQPRDDFSPTRDVGLPYGGENLLQHLDDFDSSELQWLKRMISLYVHPVVLSEESGICTHVKLSHVKHESDYDRNIAAAELRNVFTCFISPKIDYGLTGDNEKDQKLFNLLNDIMAITTKHLDSAQGHLRQFIVDDKGVVLIFTFGLRGSTFPNMIAQRAIPVTFSICESLQGELGIKAAVGATFEEAYCGVVGGISRHEFAVLGSGVNLAARLMSPKHNSGVILVDKNVRLLTSQVFFRPLPAVEAKGYADPVPIFQPMKTSANQQANKWGHAKKKFVGRRNEIKQVMQVAKDMTLSMIESKFLFVSAASGTGKSTLMVQATETVRAMVKKMKKRVIVTRYISNEGDSRIPFSLFRSIFKDLLRQLNHGEGTMKSTTRSSRQGSRPLDFEIDRDWDSLSLQSHSTRSSIMSNDDSRFRYIMEELNAPPEFMEVVGKRLLGLRSAVGPSTENKPPDLNKIVIFMADAFLRCTQHADLVLLALDDVHEMDEMSWKVVQLIFERSKNVLTFCGSRPPSTNPLAVDNTFWSELQGAYKECGRYIGISLGPFSEEDVREMIGQHLDIKADEIESSFWRNVFTTSGGMPHYLSYVLETIKRNDLTVKLDNGLIGLKSSEKDENKV